ncbi:MAG: YhcH/YjgK/YiaL family protein [Oscillospiraceae bacterium]|nr:YhcH/YjgK/YiaL family protein [Oscillospiraceae bacterium]
MIYDRIANAKNYLGIHDNLDLALNYIAEHLQDMPDSVELKGSDVRGFRSQYVTVPEEKAFFEDHNVFVDIHMMTSGQERVAVSNIDVLTAYQASVEDDYTLYHGPEDLSVVMQPGSFLIVFPGDAHKVKVAIGEPEQVSKALFKVRVK